MMLVDVNQNNMRPLDWLWAPFGEIVAGARRKSLLRSQLRSHFLLNIIPGWPLARSEYIAPGRRLAAAGCAALKKRFRFLASPWTASLPLLAAP
jgi:hypothetical protein